MVTLDLEVLPSSLDPVRDLAFCLEVLFWYLEEDFTREVSTSFLDSCREVVLLSTLDLVMDREDSFWFRG